MSFPFDEPTPAPKPKKKIARVPAEQSPVKNPQLPFTPKPKPKPAAKLTSGKSRQSDINKAQQFMDSLNRMNGGQPDRPAIAPATPLPKPILLDDVFTGKASMPEFLSPKQEARRRGETHAPGRNMGEIDPARTITSRLKKVPGTIQYEMAQYDKANPLVPADVRELVKRYAHARQETAPANPKKPRTFRTSLDEATALLKTKGGIEKLQARVGIGIGDRTRVIEDDAEKSGTDFFLEGINKEIGDFQEGVEKWTGGNYAERVYANKNSSPAAKAFARVWSGVATPFAQLVTSPLNAGANLAVGADIMGDATFRQRELGIAGGIGEAVGTIGAGFGVGTGARMVAQGNIGRGLARIAYELGPIQNPFKTPKALQSSAERMAGMMKTGRIDKKELEEISEMLEGQGAFKTADAKKRIGMYTAEVMREAGKAGADITQAEAVAAGRVAYAMHMAGKTVDGQKMLDTIAFEGRKELEAEVPNEIPAAAQTSPFRFEEDPNYDPGGTVDLLGMARSRNEKPSWMNLTEPDTVAPDRASVPVTPRSKRQGSTVGADSDAGRVPPVAVESAAPAAGRTAGKASDQKARTTVSRDTDSLNNDTTPKSVKEPWEMTYKELVDTIERGNLGRRRPILEQMFSEWLGPESEFAANDFERGVWTEYNEFASRPDIAHGVRVPFIDMSIKHKAAIQKALAEGNPVPAEVLADYPDLKPKTETPKPKTEAPKAKAPKAKLQPQTRKGVVRDATKIGVHGNMERGVKLSPQHIIPPAPKEFATHEEVASAAWAYLEADPLHGIVAAKRRQFEAANSRPPTEEEIVDRVVSAWAHDNTVADPSRAIATANKNVEWMEQKFPAGGTALNQLDEFQPQVVKGQYIWDAKQKKGIITLLSKSDISTVIHETAHHHLQYLPDVQFQAIARLAGVGKHDIESMTKTEYKRVQEFYARAVEHSMYKGTWAKEFGNEKHAIQAVKKIKQRFFDIYGEAGVPVPDFSKAKGGKLNQVEDILTGQLTVPRIPGGAKQLQDAAKWVDDYARKNPVFTKPLSELTDEEIVAGLIQHTGRELDAWVRVVQEYGDFYGGDVKKANDILNDYAKANYGREVDADEVKLFHVVSGLGSPQNTPDGDSSLGFKIWDRFMRGEGLHVNGTNPKTIWATNEKGKRYSTGVLVLDDAGNPIMAKDFPTYLDTALDKADMLIKKMGLKGAMEWLGTHHSYDEIMEVMGHKSKLKPHEYLSKDGGGLGVFGLGNVPKVGSYILNRWHEYGTITKDMWVARTMGRYFDQMWDAKGKLNNTPWKIDAPGELAARNVRLRKLLDEAWGQVAKERGMTPAGVQQAMWDAEQMLYNRLGIPREATYVSQGLQKGISLQNAEAGLGALAKNAGNGAKGKLPRVQVETAVPKKQKQGLKPALNQDEPGTGGGWEAPDEFHDLFAQMLAGTTKPVREVPSAPKAPKAEPQPEQVKPTPETPASEPAKDATTFGTSNAAMEASENLDAPKGKGKSAEQVMNDTGEVKTSAEALDLAERIASGDAPYNAKNAALANKAMSLLETRVNNARKTLEDATDANRARAIEDYENARQDLQDFAGNVQVGKSDWSDVGRVLQVKVDEAGNFAGMQKTLRGIKGKSLSVKEEDTVAKIADNYKAAQDEIANLKRELAEAQAKPPAKGKSKGPRPEQVKNARKLLDKFRSLDEEGVTLNQVGDGVKLNQVDPDEVDDVFDAIKILAREHISAGKTGLDDVADAITKEFPKLTKDDVIDALASPSSFTMSAVAKNMAALKAEARRIRGIKKAGMSLEKRKALLERQITELQRKIAEGDLSVQKRAKNGEPKDLIEKKEALLKELKDLRKAARPPKARTPKAKRAQADYYTDLAKRRQRIQDSINALNKKLQSGDVRTKTRKRRADLRDLEDARTAINKQIAAIRRAQDRIPNIEKQIAKLQARMKAKDFDTVPKEVTQKELDVQMAEEKLWQTRRAFERMKLDVANDGSGRVSRTIRAGGNLGKLWTLGADLGNVGRQGAFLGFANPRAFWKGLKSLAFKKGSYAQVQMYLETKTIDGMLMTTVRRKAGLDMTHMVGAEEGLEFFGKDVPVVGSAGRAQTGFINVARAEIFDYAYATHAFNDAELKKIAKLLNTLSGRGNIKQVEDVFQFFMTSLRFESSRWGVLTELAKTAASIPQAAVGVFVPAARLTPFQKYRLRQLGTTVGMMTTVLGITKVVLESTGQGTVEMNPFSSDFGKIRIGDRTIDFTAGVGIRFRSLYRIIAAYYHGDNKYGADELAKRGLATLSPVLSKPIAMNSGASLTGYDLDEEEKGAAQGLPLSWAQILGDAKQVHAGDREFFGAALSALAGLGGIGIQDYPASEVKYPDRKNSLLRDEVESLTNRVRSAMNR